MKCASLLPFLKDNGNVLIDMTGNLQSSLARAAHHHLDVGVELEAWPLQLAPTSPTIIGFVMGDALTVTQLKARDFKPVNIARFHPGGALGRLLSRVEDALALMEARAIISLLVHDGDLLWVYSRSKL